VFELCWDDWVAVGLVRERAGFLDEQEKVKVTLQMTTQERKMR
jgi:hypothetical protein